jgi:hypothetical protein
MKCRLIEKHSPICMHLSPYLNHISIHLLPFFNHTEQGVWLVNRVAKKGGNERKSFQSVKSVAERNFSYIKSG